MRYLLLSAGRKRGSRDTHDVAHEIDQSALVQIALIPAPALELKLLWGWKLVESRYHEIGTPK